MTAPEAQKFVTRWRRILNPLQARTQSAALRDMERSAMGLVGGMLLMLCVLWEKFPGVSGLAAIMAVAALAFLFQIRRVRQVLNERQ